MATRKDVECAFGVLQLCYCVWSSVSEAEGHRIVAVHAERCDKRSRELVGLFHLDLVVTGVSIKKG